MVKKSITNTKTKLGRKSLTTWKYSHFETLEEITEYINNATYSATEFIDYQRSRIQSFLNKQGIPSEDKTYKIKILERNSALIDGERYVISFNPKESDNENTFLRTGAKGDITFSWMIELLFSHIPAVIPLAAAWECFNRAELYIEKKQTEPATLEAMRGVHLTHTILIAQFEDTYLAEKERTLSKGTNEIDHHICSRWDELESKNKSKAQAARIIASELNEKGIKQRESTIKKKLQAGNLSKIRKKFNS